MSNKANWIIESRINGRTDRFASKDGQWTWNRDNAATFARKRDALAFVYQNLEVWNTVRMMGGCISAGRADYYAIDGSLACPTNANAKLDWTRIIGLATELAAGTCVLEDMQRRQDRAASR